MMDDISREEQLPPPSSRVQTFIDFLKARVDFCLVRKNKLDPETQEVRFHEVYNYSTDRAWEENKVDFLLSITNGSACSFDIELIEITTGVKELHGVLIGAPCMEAFYFVLDLEHRARGTYLKSLPPEIVDILIDKAIIKIGVGVVEDLLRIGIKQAYQTTVLETKVVLDHCEKLQLKAFYRIYDKRYGLGAICMLLHDYKVGLYVQLVLAMCNSISISLCSMTGPTTNRTPNRGIRPDGSKPFRKCRERKPLPRCIPRSTGGGI